MPALAIDIGTYSIKLLSGDPGKALNVSRYIEVFNNLGFVIPTDDLQTEKLTELIDSLISDNKLPRSNVRICLPENIAATKVISIPPLSDAELASAIGWQAEQHIPIPKDELALEYKVLFRPDKADKQSQMRVLLVGARKNAVERFASVFINAGIEPVLMETQMLSLIRALEFTNQDPTTMIINMGASNLDIGVVHAGEISFVFTFPIGGQLLTKTLQQTVGLDLQQAEEYKRNFGLLDNQFEGKVKQALQPPFQMIVNEVTKASKYFASLNPNESIKRVVVTGGAAQLPALAENLALNLETEVLLASPFANAKGDVPTTNHQAFTVAVGLMMREI